MSFFNPNLANPVTGVNGALQFTGTGANTCNCSTPVNNYFKNFGPRIGLAYQVDPKTVIRASYGVMFTHGNAVGGGGSTAGLAGNTLGFSASPSFSSNGQLLSDVAVHRDQRRVPGLSRPPQGAPRDRPSERATPRPAAIPVHRPPHRLLSIPIWAAALRSTSTGPSASSTSGPTPLPRTSPMSVRRVTSFPPMAATLAASGPTSSIRSTCPWDQL